MIHLKFGYRQYVQCSGRLQKAAKENHQICEFLPRVQLVGATSAAHRLVGIGVLHKVEFVYERVLVRHEARIKHLVVGL